MPGVVGATPARSRRCADPPRVRGLGAGREAADDAVVHRRHRDVQRVGGALPDAERAAPGDRLVPARVDGQRAPARDRGASLAPRPAGGRDRRRRRPVDAARRDADRRAVDLPVKVVVFNNSSLAMVRLEMLVAGCPSYATDFPPVDYAAIAAAVGIQSVRVEDRREICAALREAFAHDGPALVDLVTDPRALSMPPKITRAQVSGFARAMAKQVIGGGVADVVRDGPLQPPQRPPLTLPASGRAAPPAPHPRPHHRAADHHADSASPADCNQRDDAERSDGRTTVPGAGASRSARRSRCRRGAASGSEWESAMRNVSGLRHRYRHPGTVAVRLGRGGPHAGVRTGTAGEPPTRQGRRVLERGVP